jgi:pro-kumamolisin-like protein/Big-like domain-containing protein
LVALEGGAQQLRQTLRGHVRAAVSNGQAAAAGLVAADQRMPLSIVLPLRNRAALTSLLSRLYDPSSPDYHQFLTTAQFADQFGPTQEDYQAVVAFAEANGLTITGTPANRMLVPISGTAAQVENAFHVKMGLFHHPTENRLFFSPDREPSVDVGVPIAHIAGLNNYSLPKPMRTHALAQPDSSVQATTGSGPGGSFLASDIRAAYYGGTTLTGAGQTVALLEFDGYNPSDVAVTFANVGQSATVPIKNVLLDGASGASISGDDSEEVIDIVQAIGMAPGLSQVRVYIGSNDVDVLNAIASEDAAQQVSISWTWSPDDPATDEIFFEECAAQGQSVFAASGDWGEFDPYFDSFYPAEDDFVTATGGTVLTTKGPGQGWLAETTWNLSGGGISPDGIPIPAWQQGVATSNNGGSTTLRNVPDVAAEANTDNYICTMGSCVSNYGGTSFSAPRWAGFMALVNQQAAQAGAPPVGFLNPALYAIGEGSTYADEFRDIVTGNNDARGDCCGWPFYNAVPGYDLVTGWGTPAGQALIDALAPPAPPSFRLSSSASTVTVTPGGSATATMTITNSPGFSGSVNLAVSGLPSGVTSSWSANPASGKSTLSLSADNSAVFGSYLVMVTGTSGSATESASFALVVNAPGFTLVPSPASLKLYPGTSGTVTIFSTAANGFSGNVNFAVTSGLPAGVTASWVANPTAGASSLTFTANSSAPVNDDAMVTITGTSGNLTATTTVAVIVNPPVFYLNVSPYPSTIARGASVTLAVSAIPVGQYADTIKLSAPELAPGVTASFNPTSISFGQTSMLTLTASSSASPGAGLIGIQADGSLAETINQFNLSVTATPVSSFTLTPAQISLALAQGANVVENIAITAQNGFTGSVNLAITSALPGGVTAFFGPNPATGNSQLILTANSNASAGFYQLWITGTSGTQSATASVFVAVNPPPGYTLIPSPTTLNLTQGTTAIDTVTVAPQAGFAGTVNLAVITALPSGVTATFSPNTTTGASVLTLAAGYAAPTGNYALTIAGSSAGRTITATLPLTIAPAANVTTSTSLSVTPAGGTLTAGSPFTLTATVTPTGGSAMPTGSVAFTVGSVTSTAALNSSGVAVYSGTVPTATGALVLSAAYEGGSGFTSSTSNMLNETIIAPVAPAFNLAANSITVPAGATSGTSTITISPTGGFNGIVNLTAAIISEPAGAADIPVLNFGSLKTVAINGNASAVATLTIATTAGSTTTARTSQDRFPWATSGGATLACILLFGIPARRRSWRTLLGMVLLFCVTAGGLAGCTGAMIASKTPSGTGTTPGLYTIAITGVSGTATATANVTLTVQ